MIRVAAFMFLAATASQSPAPAEHSDIQAAAVARHGAQTHVTSILVSGNFAIVRGTAGSAAIHDGMRRSHGAWVAACRLAEGPVSATALTEHCGFSQAAAAQLSADDAADQAAAKGEFSSAAASERTALQFAAPETKLAESQRAQLLNTLNQQMNLGQISRPDAIRKWNELKFSFYLP